MFFDPLYLLFAIPGLIIAGLASLYVKATFSEYSHYQASSGLTGAEAAALRSALTLAEPDIQDPALEEKLQRKISELLALNK